jgi:hypothetical protein
MATPTTKEADEGVHLHKLAESSLAGGQGRSAHDVEQDAIGFAGVVALLAVVLVLAGLSYLVTR